MRAMILAAGRGERLRPLTDTCPKPLITIQGKTLIEYHVEALQKRGIKKVVINVSHLKEQIQDTLGNGQKWGLEIQYSVEAVALETGGGILKALPLLGDDPFIVISADIYTDFPLEKLQNKKMDKNTLAHLVLVENPEYKPIGDFGLKENRLTNTTEYTYGNIGLYRPELFKACVPGIFPLAPLLRKAITQECVTGESYSGMWSNIGTFEELHKLRETLDSNCGIQL